MLVDAKTLCQYHVDKLKKINTYCQLQVQTELLRKHASNKEFCKKLEAEALDYLQEVSKGTKQQVKAKLREEPDHFGRSSWMD
eukprot:2195432-Amphidinium_carterae.1